MLLRRAATPILLPDKPWEKDCDLSCVGVNTDIDRGLLIMHYIARPADPRKNVLCVAESRDGVVWDKPDCGDGTNIVMRALGHAADWGEFMPEVILRDIHDENPQHLWKMGYWERPEPNRPSGICLATSADGRKWTPLSDRPVIIGMNDAFSMLKSRVDIPAPSFGGRYFIYQQTWKYDARLPVDRDNLKGMRRQISLWVNQQFTPTFTGPITVLQPDERDPYDLQFYWMTPFHAKKGYGGLLHCHHTVSQKMDIQLVSSPDGYTWKRELGRRTLLPLGAPGTFDCGMLTGIAQPVLWQGKTLMFYNGYNRTHDGQAASALKPGMPKSGIGCAEMKAELLTGF